MRFTSVRLGVRTLLSMSGTTQQAKAVLAMQPNTRTGGSSVPLCCSPFKVHLFECRVRLGRLISA